MSAELGFIVGMFVGISLTLFLQWHSRRSR